MHRFFLTLSIVCFAGTSFANEAAQDSRLTVRRIFAGSEFRTKRAGAKWAPHQNAWEKVEQGALVSRDPESDQKSIVVSAEDLTPANASAALTIDSYQWSDDRSKLLIYTNSKRVWRVNSRGDYWVLDRSGHELTKLGGDAPESSLQFAKFCPDGSRVAYVRERNIYVEDLLSGDIQQITQTPTEFIINGTFDWVYEEEFRLRDGFRWSPDGSAIAFWKLNTSGMRQFSLVNQTDGLYQKITNFAYPKTGQQNAHVTLCVHNLNLKSTVTLNVPGDARDSYNFLMEWIDDTHDLLVMQLNRLQNHNQMFRVDVMNNSVTLIGEDRDEAWIDAQTQLTWLTPGKSFLWQSERDGWRHLYEFHVDAREPRLLTDSPMDVIRVVACLPESNVVYFTASPDDATQAYLYSASLSEASPPRRVTPAMNNGTNSYQISHDGSLAIHTHSAYDTPPTTSLIRLPDHSVIRVMEDNAELKQRLAELKLPRTEAMKIRIDSEVELDGWMIRPDGVDRNAPCPLLVYVYGEPAGQTVRDSYGGSTWLWHQMLVQQGYAVMSIDNRGTPGPKGRHWRKSVYRQIGVQASKDQADALKQVLQQHPWIDRNRVGIWGWSGGGSMTLNMMFRYPDLYSAGISIAPVPNQRLYDTIYQERYMGLPGDNTDGYIQGSPITFAHQLEGALLLIHGTGDDNCHYQGTEALINRLIEHNKPFQMMAYPNRSHSIREGKNTTVHLRELMTTFLQKNLPPNASRNPQE